MKKKGLFNLIVLTLLILSVLFISASCEYKQNIILDTNRITINYTEQDLKKCIENKSENNKLIIESGNYMKDEINIMFKGKPSKNEINYLLSKYNLDLKSDRTFSRYPSIIAKINSTEYLNVESILSLACEIELNKGNVKFANLILIGGFG